MARKSTVADLEATIADAQKALESAPAHEKPDLEAQIGAKSAELARLQASQTETLESVRRERDELRAAQRETAQRETMREMAAQLAAGAKAEAEAQTERQARVMQELLNTELEKVGITPGQHISDVLKTTLGGMRMGRKTPMEPTEDDGSAPSRPQAPNINKNNLGFKAWLVALTNRDYAELARIGRGHGMKALVEGGGAGSAISVAAGGALVPPDYSTEIIELLRANAVLRRSGAQIVNMTSPQYTRARQATAALANYEGETVAIPPSQETFSQMSLSAKKLTCLVPISNELLQDSNPNAEEVIKNDIAAVIGLKEDISFMYGVGGATIPLGIFKQTGIQTMTTASPSGNGDAISYATLVHARFALERANLPARRRVWITHPALLEQVVALRDNQGRPLFSDFINVQNTTLIGNGQGGVEPVGTLMGYPIMTTTQIPLGTTGTGTTTDLNLVEMSEVVIGQMGEMRMDVSSEASFFDGQNTISLWQSDMTGYRAIIRHDIGMLHAAAVVNVTQLLYV